MPASLSLDGYSLSRAIKRMAETGGTLDGLEGEVSQDLQSRTGRKAPANAFLVPWNVKARSLNTTTGSGGIPTILGPMVDILRNKLVLASLGAQVLPDLRGGLFTLPRKTATTTVGWAAEGGTPAPSNPTITGQVPLTPRTTGGTCLISRKAIDSIPACEQVIIDDIMGSIAAEIERVAIAGNGTDEPLGLLSTPLPTVEIGTNGGPPTRDMAIAMERLLGNAKAEVGPLSWLGSPDTRSAMRAVQVGDGSKFLWSDENAILSGRAVATTAVPTGLTKGSGTGLTALILGAFSQMIIGLWGPATVIVDIYKFAVTGYIYVTVLQDVDVNRRYDSAFVKCIDIAQS